MAQNQIGASLHVLIVGAGIAGLAAATALKKAGHKVEIFERSSFADEVGAAVLMTSNGTRVLKALGFDFAAGGGVRLQHFNAYDTLSLQPGPKMDIGNTEEPFGGPMQSIHRQDLHGDLVRMATAEAPGEIPAAIHLGTKIKTVDVEKPSIEMEDGSVVQGDLLLGADGIHSIVRKTAVVGEEKPIDSGFQMYRFLVSREEIEKDEVTKGMMERNTALRFFHGDPLNDDLDRFIWFECRNRDVQSFVVFHRSVEGVTDVENFKLPTEKSKVLKTFNHIHPNLIRIIDKASKILSWRIYERLPLPALLFGNSKTLLIGDAGHPMSPFSGQGANQALEDAGALLILLSNLPRKEDMRARLKVFEEVRLKRVSRIQVMAAVPLKAGNPLIERQHEFVQRDDGPPKGLSFPESFYWDFKYNVFEYCENALEKRR